MDDERRRAWEKELEDDWAQAQFEEASRERDHAPPSQDPSLPPIKPGPRSLSPQEWAAGVAIWCQAAATWRGRALSAEQREKYWRRSFYRLLAGTWIVIAVVAALGWWGR